MPTGQPANLRCARCRIGSRAGEERFQQSFKLRSTGEIKRRGKRRAFGYVCLGCGHRGFSTHPDAVLLRKLGETE